MNISYMETANSQPEFISLICMYIMYLFLDIYRKMFKRKSNHRLFEMEAENEQLKRENETLKREIAELKEMNDKLKQSLDDAVRSTRPKPQPAPRGLRPTNSQFQSSSETADAELRKLIRQLLDTQDRLTVAEQVTAATQRRELVQEGVYENLPRTGVYEELRFDPTQVHFYTALQPISHSGCIIVFCQ